MIIVNGWKPLTIITKSSILDVAAVLDPPVISLLQNIITLSALFSKPCLPNILIFIMKLLRENSY